MNDLFNAYIQSVSNKFSHKETSEMGYRADFEILLKGIFESINVKRIDHDASAKQYLETRFPSNKFIPLILQQDMLGVFFQAREVFKI